MIRLASPRTRAALGAAALAVVTLTTGAGVAPAAESRLGPPLICNEFNIGEAKSLRSGSTRIVEDTLAILTPDTPVIVRMETLRRALMQGMERGASGKDLQLALQARVLDGEAREKADALAWFDAGYCLATWHELDDKAPEAGMAQGCVGYAWVQRAIAIAKDNPEMELAAALATHPLMHKGTHEVSHGHLARAAAGAAKDSLLEKNLKNLCRSWGESYDTLRAKGGAARADGDHR